MVRRIEVIPGLVLDEGMFELTAAALAEHAGDIDPLAWEDYIDPGPWSNIPNAYGHLSKSERILYRGPERTVIANVWHTADLRSTDGRSIPHNHPWRFRSYLLRGTYTEQRWRRCGVDPDTDRAEILTEPLHIHTGPTLNEVPEDVYHEIPHVEPATLSLMICGPRTPDPWSHLDLETGRRRREQPVTGFHAMLTTLNPHKRGERARRAE